MCALSLLKLVRSANNFTRCIRQQQLLLSILHTVITDRSSHFRLTSFSRVMSNATSEPAVSGSSGSALSHIGDGENFPNEDVLQNAVEGARKRFTDEELDSATRERLEVRRARVLLREPVIL